MRKTSAFYVCISSMNGAPIPAETMKKLNQIVNDQIQPLVTNSGRLILTTDTVKV